MLADGEDLLRGWSVTCFSNEEGAAFEFAEAVPFRSEDRLRERGATVLTAAAFEFRVVAWERLVTGQNPAFARALPTRWSSCCSSERALRPRRAAMRASPAPNAGNPR